MKKEQVVGTTIVRITCSVHMAFAFIIDAIYLRQVLKCSLLFNGLKDWSADSLVSYTQSFVSSVLCR